VSDAGKWNGWAALAQVSDRTSGKDSEIRWSVGQGVHSGLLFVVKAAGIIVGGLPKITRKAFAAPISGPPRCGRSDCGRPTRVATTLPVEPEIPASNNISEKFENV
jgi:hypothetical protein